MCDAMNSSLVDPPADSEDNSNNKSQTAPLLIEVTDDGSLQAQSQEKNETISSSGQGQGSEWSPGALRQFPYAGILSLLGCISCIAATVAILKASDGQPTDDWSLSPTVYLALLTTALNRLAQVAFSEGVKIVWWRAAIRGTTVSHLHRYWASGDSTVSALQLGRGFNIVSLAKLAVTLIAIDQPLIQRASSVVAQHPENPISVSAPIAPEIPYGYTASQFGRALNVADASMTVPMLAVFGAYNSKAAIIHNFTGCAGTCTGAVHAGGFTADCSTNSIAVDVLSLIPPVSGLQQSHTSMSPFNVSWNVNFNQTRRTADISFLAYFINETSPETCTSTTMVQKKCRLRLATLEYPVQLQGETLTFTEAIDNLTVISLQPSAADVNLTVEEDGGLLYTGWTTVGFALAATSIFTSKATYNWIQGAIQLSLPDVLSNQFMNIESAVSPGCANWTDPTSYMLSVINEMAFRISLNASNAKFGNTSEPPQPQVLTMKQMRNINVFKSDFRYLIASTVLSFFFVLLITPTFYGWWLLGRNVSLNPIETAKAFDAELLQGPGSNAPQDELIRIVGLRKLKLGEIQLDYQDTAETKLKLVDPADAVGPRTGTLYA
ncbi:hypothetical protein GGI35DRAFT_459520 [Trichoderma velutinum]